MPGIHKPYCCCSLFSSGLLSRLAAAPEAQGEEEYIAESLWNMGFTEQADEEGHARSQLREA